MTNSPSPNEDQAGFTPGPWSVVPYGDGDSLVVHAGAVWRICFMATPGDSPGAMEKIEANVRLIAAAPDMFEALKEAERFLDYFVNGRTSFVGGGTPRSALELVQAALSKAINP